MKKVKLIYKLKNESLVVKRYGNENRAMRDKKFLELRYLKLGYTFEQMPRVESDRDDVRIQR